MLFATAVAVVGNVLSAVIVVITNKRIVELDNFDHIIFITGCHFYSNFIGCCILLALGGFRYKNPGSFRALLLITLVMLPFHIFH